MRSKRHDNGARGRIALAIIACIGIYGAIGARLVTLGMAPAEAAQGLPINPQDEVQASRPDIVDRNGEVLATDLATASLYAEPRNISDVDEAVEQLTALLPELDPGNLRTLLGTDRGFEWLKREVSGRLREKIHNLGLPGVGFLTETRRFYPGGPAVGHIVGHVNIDNAGIAGLEKSIDGSGLRALQAAGLARKGQAMAPVRLSLDLRVQHAVRDELSRAMERYRAIAAVGIVLDARTLEVVAMSSLPDYDPNRPEQALDDKRMNRALTGVFELGSIFKSFTMASALDAGTVALDTKVDARYPLTIGRFTIKDFHAKRRWLDVGEVFKYSSNIGTAKIAKALGKEKQQAYLRTLGMFDRVRTELPEAAKPLVPRRWADITAATVSYGHGLSVTPMHAAAAAAAILNGGIYANPTFYPRSEAEMLKVGHRVISEDTSRKMRGLFYLNAQEGSGRQARVPGYNVGGKTGTAEKVVNGGYSDNKKVNSFLAAFPIDDPQYIVLVTLDEPKPEKGKTTATAGMNAAPTVANIVSRIGPMLSVEPLFQDDDAVARAIEVAYQE
ncbi:penicillin-binding protein 2 [Acuticoccus sp. MNP-M23]|uniref:peptidoglycan D,D-transpeptidase FtsI family protein n=1 Tax=Acuticoccus sp. MNP-M23 TaxID=3072793 RepID=UPI002815EEF1|nr:penicillin-binding protein 2 [Acuticoccus sp. MNP-M23]WMS40848.1 penicillin-binding protein 2 [Acuticoccus sp. MNP-M23]